ncbi:MAG: hypothetical protein H0X67_13025 [Acidobacteria bacterium]|nr:hypothetical protein [Acidobacteriota bacterium]
MTRVLLVLAMLCAAPPLAATVILPADFRDLVTGSQVIVYGRVADVRAEWTADRRRIESVVTLEVGSYLKGGPGEHVTFRVEGGQIGRYKSVTIGAPEFSPGDEAVFFLTSRGPSVARIFGMGQGVFRVRPDASGQRLVVPPALMTHGTAHTVLRRGAPERRTVPLEVFAVQVRDTMAEGRVAR